MFLCRLRTNLRSLSSSAARADVSPTILEILQQKSPAEAQAAEAARKKRILILSPEETKDKTLSNFVNSARKAPRAKRAPRPVGIDESLLAEASTSDITASFENFRHTHGVGGSGASAAEALKKSFTRSQLAHYVQAHAPKPYKKSATKKELSQYIVEHLWNQAPAAALAPVFQKERIPLRHQEIFLLLCHRGSFLRALKSTVSSLDFDTKKKELVLVGTERQLQNAKINLAHRFESVHREVFDLTTIQELYRKKFGSFTFEDIGKMIEVYFHHLDGNRYELCALNPDQIKRVKRLLVWFLDYNEHRADHLHLPENLDACSLVSFTDDYGMTWKNRSKAHFRLVDDTGALPSSISLTRDLELFSDENLKDLDVDLDLRDLRKPAQPSALADDAYDLLSSLGLSKEDLAEGLDAEEQRDEKLEEELEEKELEAEELEAGELKIGEELGDVEELENVAQPKEVEPVAVTEEGLLSERQKDTLYRQLTDFHYRETAAGAAESQLDAPMFTVTLGHVLFPQEKQKNSPFACPPSKDRLPQNVAFHSNVPLVYDQTLVRATGGVEEASEDPHSYNLQFKFLPSPYGENGSEQMKHPPVEMWLSLNASSVPDLETVQLVSVEAENNAYVCLPQQQTDMKITCQMTGQLLEAAATAASTGAAELASLLASTSSKYPQLGSQPGLQAFLEQSRLELNRKAQTSVAPTVDLRVGGHTVTYAFVSLNYRRELMVELEAGRAVQLSVIDGGVLGGRRVEARFVGDLAGDLSRAAFDRLVDYCGAFVRDL